MAKLAEINPFNINDIAAAKAVVEQADMAIAFYKKCTGCGADFSTLIEQVQAYREFALSVIQNWEHTAHAAE